MRQSEAPWQVSLEGWALASGIVSGVAVGGCLRFAMHVVVSRDSPVVALSALPPAPAARFLGRRTEYDLVARVVEPAGRVWILDIGVTAFCTRRALPPTVEPGSWVQMRANLEVDPTGDLYRSGADPAMCAAAAQDWQIEEIWSDQASKRFVKWGDPDYPGGMPDEGLRPVPAGPEQWLEITAPRSDPQVRRTGVKLLCRPTDLDR